MLRENAAKLDRPETTWIIWAKCCFSSFYRLSRLWRLVGGRWFSPPVGVVRYEAKTLAAAVSGGCLGGLCDMRRKGDGLCSLLKKGKAMSLAQREGAAGVQRGSSGDGRRRRLHRLAEVRQREGITRRTVARRLHTTVAAVRAMEEADDLSLTQLYAWQKALRVPVGELLGDSDDGLSAPVLKRARLVRLMKTASAIFHWSRQKSIRRLAQMLIEQLVELMPELAQVGPWPLRGRRRQSNELGAAFQHQISPHPLADLARENH